MTCYKLGDSIPSIHETAYVAAEATIIGKASMAANSSIWPGAVIRGDNELISVGKGSNVQECAVLHTDPGCPLTIGENVTIGHQAMLHGCTIEDGALIGIQAIVLNRAVIGEYSLVGAGAIVTEDKVFPARSLILGAPAKVVRPLTDDEVAKLKRSAQGYADRAARFKTELVAL
ncbi:gamma carbonic anhydrase family protein [Alcaligenaceae bacterium]|nr:gamma carbonic anhydrase family protein [Alcaligenaceae bacterium]